MPVWFELVCASANEQNNNIKSVKQNLFLIFISSFSVCVLESSQWPRTFLRAFATVDSERQLFLDQLFARILHARGLALPGRSLGESLRNRTRRLSCCHLHLAVPCSVARLPVSRCSKQS